MQVILAKTCIYSKNPFFLQKTCNKLLNLQSEQQNKVQQIKGIEKDINYNMKSEQKQYKHLEIKERVKIETMMNDQLVVYGKVNIITIEQVE